MIYESGHRTALVRLHWCGWRTACVDQSRRRGRDGAERGSAKIEQRCLPPRRGRVATDRAGHGRQRTIVVATTVTC